MKKIVLSIIILLIVLLVIFIFIGNFFYNLALNTNTSKDFLADNANIDYSEMEDIPISEEDINNIVSSYKSVLDWADKNSTNLSLASFDNLDLNAYYYENPDQENKYAILVHGYNGNSRDMAFQAKEFHKNGYSVLTPDCRGAGLSEGSYIGMGWHDRLDILQWIDFIIDKDPQAKIVLYGVSMGGATVMMVSGEELPKNVVAIVEDCGYTNVTDIFTYQLKSLFKLPKFPAIHFSSLVTKLRAGYLFSEASAIEQVKKSKTPTLFIHGDKDDFVPFYMLDQVYEAGASPKEKYVVKGAGHGMAPIIDGGKYWSRVFKFIDQYM